MRPESEPTMIKSRVEPVCACEREESNESTREWAFYAILHPKSVHMWMGTCVARARTWQAEWCNRSNEAKAFPRENRDELARLVGALQLEHLAARDNDLLLLGRRKIAGYRIDHRGRLLNREIVQMHRWRDLGWQPQ